MADSSGLFRVDAVTGDVHLNTGGGDPIQAECQEDVGCSIAIEATFRTLTDTITVNASRTKSLVETMT